MGLDSFTTGDSSTSSGDIRGSSTADKSSDNKPPDQHEAAFKTIGSGSSQLKFQTEEEWQAFVEFVEGGLGFDMDRVMDWTDEKRRDFIGHAHSFRNEELHIEEYEVTQKCIVCGHEFSFPHDWDLILFNHKAVCPDHQIGEVAEAYDQLD